MQCLVEIARQEYALMGHYIDRLSEVSANAAKLDAREVGCQGIELWTTLAEVEYARLVKQGQILNIIFSKREFLVPLLLECIGRVEVEDAEDAEEEWGVNLASGCCLTKISLILQNEVVGPVVNYVKAYVQSTDWTKRYSALMALGAISEGPEKLVYAAVLNPSMNSLLAMFQDESVKVREAIAWVTSQICTHHADVMTTTPEQTAMFVNILVAALQDKVKVSVYLCQAIEKLAESLAPLSDDQQENQLTPHFEKIAQGLFTNSTRVAEDETGSIGIVQASYAALTTLCQHSCSSSDQSLQ